MPALVYVRLIGFATGTLLHLFLVILVAGYRRPRAFERVLFFLALSLFLFYSGVLLGLNAELYYPNPPPTTLAFAVVLVALGLGFLPPLLGHVHAAYDGTLREAAPSAWSKALVWAAYLPLVYFGPVGSRSLLENLHLEFLKPGSRIGSLYGFWWGAALLACFFFHHSFARRVADQKQKQFHRALMVFFGVASPLLIYTYGFGGPRDPGWSAGLATATMLASLVPSSLLGYFVLRYNFLEIGGQRNLVYAVSAAFLALLYLAVVRRVETWLDPVLPPDATASILLFVLMVFFEPLQRRVGHALRRTFQAQVDRLQRLGSEFEQEARRGDLERLVELAGERIRDEFGLAAVCLRVRGGPPRDEAPVPGAGRSERFVLHRTSGEIGVLEASAYGAAISGETYAALEFLAEQLPAVIDLCRLIEEKLQLERELAERERLALVGQMAASISHNLKNPLGSMKTLLQVQLENPELPESVRKDRTLGGGRDRPAGREAGPIAPLRQASRARRWRNLRELKNALERSLILASGEEIGPEDLPEEIRTGQPLTGVPSGARGDLPLSEPDFREAKRKFEIAYLDRKLEEHRWNVSRTAAAIGLHRQSLQEKLRELGIQRPGKAAPEPQWS